MKLLFVIIFLFYVNKVKMNQEMDLLNKLDNIIDENLQDKPK